MERGSARLFQHATRLTEEHRWNIVELATHKQVRQDIETLLRLAGGLTVTTSQMRQYLLQGVATFGPLFATHLVRSLYRTNPAERQSVVWLLTVLNHPETIPPLQRITGDARLPRMLRLSASLALAGMGVTADMLTGTRQTRLYAIT